jgi:chromosome segregation ATPase
MSVAVPASQVTVNGIPQELTESIKGLSPALRKEIVQTFKDASAAVIKGNDLSDKAQKQIEKIQAQAAAASQGMPAVKPGITTQSKIDPSDNQSANSSNVLARLDQIIKNVGEMINEVNVMQPEISDLNATPRKLDIKDLKDQLKALQEQLKTVSKKLAEEKKILSGMRQNDVPEMQKALASQSEAVKKEREKLLDDIQKVEKQMEDLKKLSETQPGNKKLIEKQLSRLESELKKMLGSYKDLNVNYEIAKGSSDALDGKIAEQEKVVEGLTGKVGQIKQGIKDIQKAIVQLSKKNGSEESNRISVLTPMFSPRDLVKA